MKEPLLNDNLKELREEYILLKRNTFNKDFIIFGKNKRQFIVTKKSKKELINFIYSKINDPKDMIEINIFESLSLFLTENNNLYIPEIANLKNNNIYIGSYRVYILIKGNDFE